MKYMYRTFILFSLLITLTACGSDLEDNRTVVATESQGALVTVGPSEQSKSLNQRTTIPKTTLGPIDQASEDYRQKAEEIIAEMTIEEKVGQLFYVSLPTYRQGLIPAGGVIFFKADMATKESLSTTMAYLQKASIPLYLGIDEEGGIISRLSGETFGLPVLPSPWDQAHSDQKDLVFENSRLIAEGLEGFGFNMNFAPVADIHTNPENPVIGHRAYSDKPEDVAHYVLESLRAYSTYNVTPVIKHFPGHGDTHGDSHLSRVFIDGDLDALKKRELIPFQAAIDQGVDFIMIGHIRLPKVTNDDLPATLSKQIITDLLREDMGYEGLIISDSLIMGSITDDYSHEEVMLMGLEAGLTMFLMPEMPEESYEFLVAKTKEDVTVERLVNQAVVKIIEHKLKCKMLTD